MSIEVRGSVIRLDVGSFEELVGERPTGHEAFGVPGVAEAIEAVRDPAAHLDLDVAGPALVQHHRVWVDHEMSAFLLGVREDEHQLLAVPPALLGAGLARVLRIGPRPVGPREPREVDEDLLEDLFHDDEMRRRSAYAGLDAHLAWNMGLFWPEGRRWFSVVDGPSGLWWVEGEAGARVLTPTTATEVWRVLSSLLALVPD